MLRNIQLGLALLLGLSITLVDSQSTWDDTGITAAALISCAAMLGFLGPQRPWIWALALGLWIPLFGILKTNNYWSLLALLVALAGAYSGSIIRRYW